MKKPWIVLLFPCFVFAQSNTDSLQNLQEVEVKAIRLKINQQKAPFAVGSLDKFRLQTAMQQLSPHESLGAVAGVFSLNAENYSQDLRIAIRGFGARSSFGIRGIRLFVDGLPEGTPDGQVDVDNLDMGSIAQMEVLKGATAGLYGNAAGGAILLETENPERLLLESQVVLGSFGLQRYQVKAGQTFSKLGYFVSASTNKIMGYRDWSNMKNTLMYAKIRYAFKPKTLLTLIANYGDSPTANDAGGLTELQIASNPSQAHSNNRLYETGERIKQNKIGATFESQITKKQQISAKVFRIERQLDNRLAIFANGYGNLHREYWGGGLAYQFDEHWNGKTYRLKIGIDLDKQSDHRQRSSYKKITENGISRYLSDKLVLNQIETFQSTGIYCLQDFQPNTKTLFSIALRFDDLALDNSDQFLSDGNQSGQRHYQKINPLAGVSYQISKNSHVYSNFSTTFESPTLNELSNNPTGQGGFNPEIKAQTAQSFEIGLKSKRNSFQYDLAIFRIRTQNDLVPYQIASQAGKIFFRNAGETLRKGIEANITWTISRGLTLFLAHTVSDFRYKSYTANNVDYANKYLPLIPKQYGQVECRYFSKKSFFLILQSRYQSKIFANDANSVSTKSQNLLHVRLGYTFKTKNMGIEPFLGINNCANVAYMSNVLVNASNDRYFEPASPRNYFGGIKLSRL